MAQWAELLFQSTVEPGLNPAISIVHEKHLFAVKVLLDLAKFSHIDKIVKEFSKNLFLIL